MTRSPNPEMVGGSIALAVNNNDKAQELPTSLARMDASERSQAAFNATVPREGTKVVAINSDIPDFLTWLSMAVPVIVSINAPETFKGSQPVCGQLWTQQERINSEVVLRQMAAFNDVLPDIGTSRKAILLSGVADVLAWPRYLEISAYETVKRQGRE
jgi:hypothetical protein